METFIIIASVLLVLLVSTAFALSICFSAKDLEEANGTVNQQPSEDTVI